MDGITSSWPWPAVLLEDSGVVQLGAALRRYHEAVATFVPQADAHWQEGAVPLLPGQIVRHADLGPWNLVWKASSFVGIIDWDSAGPGEAMDDVLQALWHVVPLYNHGACRAAGFDRGVDRLARARAFLDAYGIELDISNERDLAVTVLEYANREREWTARLGAAGQEPWATLLARREELNLKYLWLEAEASPPNP